MGKSIFISCVHEDSQHMDSIKKWAKDNLLGSVIITHETEDKRHLGKEAIKQHIKYKIEGCAFILVLIGDTTHNHDWVTVEVELANSFHKEILCLRIPNTKGAVPTILNKYRVINFDPDSLKREIGRY